jgi:hypothetical protein
VIPGPALAYNTGSSGTGLRLLAHLAATSGGALILHPASLIVFAVFPMGLASGWSAQIMTAGRAK